MGAYVNPQGATKEAWLEQHGEKLQSPPDTFDEHEGFRAVCLVDNYAFSAAGIIFNERELKDFTDPHDKRPKAWYRVKHEKLYEVSDLVRYER